MLRALYVIAIGLLFAGFIGFGVATFYPAPKFPECGRETEKVMPAPGQTNAQLTPKERIAADQCKNLQDDFQKESGDHSRNLSVIFLLVSVVVIAVSLFGLGRVEVIGDGITLGGVFLLFTSLATSLGNESGVFRFLTVTVGLVVVIFLSYWKFIRNKTTNI